GAASAAAPAAAEAAPSAWQRWLAALDSWVLHYDATRRRQLVEAGAQGGSGWLVLALRLGAALALVAAAAWGWRRWRDGRGSDPLLQAWAAFRARLAAAGVESRNSECPSALRARLAALPAPWAAPAAALVDEWLAARYAAAPPDAAAQLRLARRLAAFRPLVFEAGGTTSGSRC
ncbi:hypothetical protein CKO44_23770, partial [Rubrivivax gelatinosus]|uniref:hypothetical protein n=1 Tax=Rubrivivax gelatinosus TaxID=28068 RepID=UPI002178F435|nr:hypothetical protein [Rubrivivax gelatinosus]